MNGESEHSGACFDKSQNYLSRSIQEETILVPVGDSVAYLDSVYVLNEMAGRIWSLLDGHISVAQIAKTICEEYDVTEEEALTDVVQFLEGIEKNGLVQATAS